jgi:Z1 domain.
MTEISPVYMQVRQLALVLLKGEENPTPQSIRNKVDIAIMASKSAGADGDVDAEAIAKEIESLYSVWIDTGKALDDKTDHKPWLPDKRAQIEWKFWRRYERYLEEEMGWPPQVVNRLGDLTDSILERLEDSERPAPWDRRGMVVGSVQSGKTANYTGLICKAVDAGYKLVIILAGMHNSLRSQTQLRIDEGVLGFDTQKSRKFNQDSQRIGVGLLQNEPLFIHSLTNSAEHGDFKRNIADTVGVMIGGDPVILVVKKNKSVLNNLIQWALTVRGHMDTATRKRMIRNVPLLLIDDEADNASINTKKLPDPVNGQLPDDYDVTAINEKIRELLSSFDKCAYVGYTATPFANIFINPDCSTQRLGDDIFPRSFIINLPVSSNYVGPARVFGLDSDPDAGIEGLDPLPIIRVVKDYDAFFPENHKKDLAVPGLPKSLKEAIRAFILTCATRWARGQISVHNSMLIHVTRYVDVQRQITQLVRDELASLKRRIAYGDGNSPRKIRSELESLWKNDFESTSLAMPDYVPNQVSWEEVNEALHAATSKIEVKEINGTAMDILDYVEHSGGRSVIAIGGDKLSRGLTLEGLSISYYLRASKMYDTLMQMGRWFGYRPGYPDLCRLYTTRDLVQWYRHITLAEQELRREFEYMWSSGRTPSDYGLRVRTHPEGLLITALNKMREGVTMQLSYAGELVETALFLYRRQHYSKKH